MTSLYYALALPLLAIAYEQGQLRQHRRWVDSVGALAATATGLLPAWF